MTTHGDGLIAQHLLRTPPRQRTRSPAPQVPQSVTLHRRISAYSDAVVSLLPPKPPVSSAARHVVFFDADCLMCDGTVRLLMDHDSGNVLHFATLQGPHAKKLIEEGHLPTTHDLLGTLVFAENLGHTSQQKVSLHSTAVLRICDKIGGRWRVMSWLRIVPRPIRDAVYKFVAANRYKWFGKRPTNSCFLPDANQAAKFMD